MGKTEGQSKDWHGHVTAVTICPTYRRLGLARTLMAELERITQDVAHGYFVDLFVRVSNEIAIGMYRGLGYSVFRRVVNYYSGDPGGAEDEDAYGKSTNLHRPAIIFLVGLRNHLIFPIFAILDMRKPMKRDKLRQSIRENGENFCVPPEAVIF